MEFLASNWAAIAPIFNSAVVWIGASLIGSVVIGAIVMMAARALGGNAP